MVRNIAFIVLAALLVAGGSLWMNGVPTGSLGSIQPQVRALYANTGDAQQALAPNVITTASKLGQGRAPVPGLPVTDDFAMPTLRETEAGLALLIAGRALPATTRHTELATLTDSRDTGLRFDLYSWSMGTLVATTPRAIAIGAAHPDVPEALMTLARGADHSKRLLLVLPPGLPGLSEGTSALPAALNSNDAYVIVAEVRLSTGR